MSISITDCLFCSNSASTTFMLAPSLCPAASESIIARFYNNGQVDLVGKSERFRYAKRIEVKRRKRTTRQREIDHLSISVDLSSETYLCNLLVELFLELTLLVSDGSFSMLGNCRQLFALSLQGLLHLSVHFALLLQKLLDLGFHILSR